MEHKLLYKVPGREEVPEGAYRIPLGVSRVLRDGKDLTVVATGIMVSRAMAAADLLEKEGVFLTIIDPRTISPLDMDPIYSSVERTGRLMVIQEAPEHGGFLNEVIAKIATGPALGYLIAPVVRLAGMNIPIPYAPQLEKAAVPQVEDIIKQAREVVANWR